MRAAKVPSLAGTLCEGVPHTFEEAENQAFWRHALLITTHCALSIPVFRYRFVRCRGVALPSNRLNLVYVLLALGVLHLVLENVDGVQ